MEMFRNAVTIFRIFSILRSAVYDYYSVLLFIFLHSAHI